MIPLARASFCVYRRGPGTQNPPEGKHSLPAQKTDRKRIMEGMDHGYDRNEA